MARRRGNSFGWFKFALALIVICLCAGAVAAWVTRYNVTRQSQGQPGLLATVAKPVAAGGFTANVQDLSKMTRPQLESEVARLNTELAEKNRQLDDLKIQLKLMGEGSRAAN